ncbi:RcnB family protein [Sphingomonas sp. RHCKR47]|uniref:RcnB family protein n=1 Tax=Sphingomonas citricola TaxID=2862498 RepID=UPI001C6848D3|nr:RcnB family protein [Sphingomonas citricola]MBW6523931.1 RcnB family protein [Sphingomonas citricola]
MDRRDWSWRSGTAGSWGRQAQRGWDRGWRQDRRYDWSGYRNSNRAAYRLPRYYAPYGWNGGYRRFGVGARLSSVLFAQSYWIDDPFAYRLPEPYGPYRWVRYYNDAILVDIDTGEIVDVINDLFW